MTKQSEKKVRFRTVICILLSLLLLFNVLTLILQSRGKDFLGKTSVALLQVSGGSMEPVLHNGDAIIVRQEPFSELSEGDIIVFCREDELIVHEIILKGDSSLITQGAANEFQDEPVSESEYRAKVLCRIPGLGEVWSIYSSPVLFLLWVLLLILLLFGKDIFPALYEKLQIKKQKKT